MFYAHFVLAKKGPLARIWLAAHWDKKLTKAHVFETNIESSVEGILQPKVKMALRTSGHLLLGIVRIYSRKAKYLLADCNEAFIKIKMAFRPGVVDLPEENREAAVNSITLPEVFHDFETGMPDLQTLDMEAAVTANQSRAEDITLKEDYGMGLMGDDGFGDMTFDDAEIQRDVSQMEEAFDAVNAFPSMEPSDFGDVTHKDHSGFPHHMSVSGNDTAPVNQVSDLNTSLNSDGFGGQLGQGLLDNDSRHFYDSHFESAGLFDEPPPAMSAGGSELRPGQQEQAPPESDDDDDDMYDMGGGPMGGSSPPSSPGGMDSAAEDPRAASMQSSLGHHDFGAQRGSQDPSIFAAPQSVPSMMAPPTPGGFNGPQSVAPPTPVDLMPPQSSMLGNDEEAFPLPPMETPAHLERPSSVISNLRVPQPRTTRKRKLIVDEVKNISGEEMKSQLSDTSDIVTTLDLAPPTKRLMHWKETGGVEKLFALPARPILSKVLSQVYQRHLTTYQLEPEGVDLMAQHQPQTPLLQAPPTPMHMAGAPETPLPPHMHTPHHDMSNQDLRPPESVGPPPMSVGHTELEEELQELNATLAQSEAPSPGMNLFPPMTPAPPTPAPHQAPPTPHPAMDQQQSIFDGSGGFNGSDHDQQQQQQQHPFDSQYPDAPTSVPAPFSVAANPLGSDDDDDYQQPFSVGPTDEQQQDETYEEFEERILNKRTVHMLNLLGDRLNDGNQVRFSDVARHSNRKQVAQKFYTFLVLKKQQAVELSQSEPYAELFVTKGPKYEQAFH